MNIYISNLSYAVNDGDLKDLFGEYGEISSAKVITDRETGRSRGFGFVEMADDAQGQKAIDELNQAEYDGKVINVTVARPRTERPAGNRGGFHRNNNFNGGGCLILNCTPKVRHKTFGVQFRSNAARYFKVYKFCSPCGTFLTEPPIPIGIPMAVKKHPQGSGTL